MCLSDGRSQLLAGTFTSKDFGVGVGGSLPPSLFLQTKSSGLQISDKLIRGIVGVNRVVDTLPI